MKRRHFIKNCTLGAAATLGGSFAGTPVLAGSMSPEPEEKKRLHRAGGPSLFPIDVPGKQWAHFEAQGYSHPVCGVVYRLEDDVPHGMPLGGVATGSIDVDTDGTFGYCTLFNSGVPTRGPLQYGFLGVSSEGRTWILSSRSLPGMENARQIHYWGHYPIADIEYELDGPLSVGLRAWSPFIPGDAHASNVPCAVFEVHVRNLTSAPRPATVGFSFPGPTQAEAQIGPASLRAPRLFGFPVNESVADGLVAPTREVSQDGELTCLTVTVPTRTGYTLGAIGENRVRFGGGLWVNGYDYVSSQHWSAISNHLQRTAPYDLDSAVSVDVALAPREDRVIRFVLAWYSPLWKGEKTNVFYRMYTERFSGSLDAAQALGRKHPALLKRTIAWQEVIYGEKALPDYLRDSLINIFHLITKTGYWAMARPPLPGWCRADEGLFGMNESPRDCPQMECIPCSFYGNIPLVYFFPELARSTLRGYKGYQYPDGGPPWLFGGITAAEVDGGVATDPCDMASPTPGYQSTMNGPAYIDMFDRYWLRTGDEAVLKDFYESLKKAVVYTVNLRPGPEGLISVPAGDRNPTQPHRTPGLLLEWFEGNKWFGMTPHVGGVHLAMFRMAERLAERAGDAAFAAQCRAWIETGSRILEAKLWAGNYYLAYYEPEKNKKSDLVFAFQLDGEWMTRYHGLPGVFRKDRVPVTLKTIEDTNVALNRYGAANFAHPDGKPVEGVAYGTYGYFVPEVFMLAATYIYNGQRELGLRLLRGCLEGIALKRGDLWTQPNVVSGDTGKRIYGSDYYQNMILWSLPAALAGHDVRQACAPGSLVDRILQAAKGPALA
ncbi:MAG: GH116 family glycosyl-hydrolase [Acidobacteria bacterium]|nr:GH116 family glycosyl-hydrolase [Acidobacteriota bacterium]